MRQSDGQTDRWIDESETIGSPAERGGSKKNKCQLAS